MQLSDFFTYSIRNPRVPSGTIFIIESFIATIRFVATRKTLSLQFN